jgi:hypothetical protein
MKKLLIIVFLGISTNFCFAQLPKPILVCDHEDTAKCAEFHKDWSLSDSIRNEEILKINREEDSIQILKLDQISKIETDQNEVVTRTLFAILFFVLFTAAMFFMFEKPRS